MGKLTVNIIVTIAVIIWILAEWINMKVFWAEEWTKSTHKLNSNIIELWVDWELSWYVINGCKRNSKDPNKCVKTYVSHYGTESWFGRHCKSYACWGRRFVEYPTRFAAFDDWLWRYNTYWYPHTGGSYFYGGRGWLGRSEFCHDEVSSWSKLGCPNWAKTFNYFYNKL